MTEPKTLTHSESQAVAQLESIRAMVAALGCDYDRLAELRADNNTHIDRDNAEELAALETAAGDCSDREDAERRIHEDALSVEVRSDWHAVGEDSEDAEFLILLCTGGPACRIVGELCGGEPSRARIEHQDWGTPWTEWRTTSEEKEALLAYCRCFYFGE